MGYLTAEQKFAIVFHRRQGRSLSQISTLCNVSRTCVKRWMKRWAEEGCVDVRKAKKSIPLVGEHAARRARQLLKEGTDGGLKGVSRIHYQEGFTWRVVSPGTFSLAVKKRAKGDGITLKVYTGKPKKALTRAQCLKRLDFVEANQGKNWYKVMFTDRKKFHLSYPGSSVRQARWREGDEEDAVPLPNHPSCVNVYGGITRWGTTDLIMVTGTSNHASSYVNSKGQQAKNITSAEYKDVCHHLLHDGNKLFSSRGTCEWVFQQDKDPTHPVAGPIIKAFNQEKCACVKLLQGWPGNSPDLNLIENVWSWVQNEVNKKACRTFAEFEVEVQNVFRSYPRTMLDNLWKSIPKRLDLVVEMEGKRVKY